jgi:hypothetical protein
MEAHRDMLDPTRNTVNQTSTSNSTHRFHIIPGPWFSKLGLANACCCQALLAFFRAFRRKRVVGARFRFPGGFDPGLDEPRDRSWGT